MMISVFARESGLSVDTVRFYVRRGLLRPEIGQKGGSRPYQMFSLLDVEKARIIRAGQALGLSLEEIGSFLKTRTFDGAENDHLLAFLPVSATGSQRGLPNCRSSSRSSTLRWLGSEIPSVELRRRFQGDSANFSLGSTPAVARGHQVLFSPQSCGLDKNIP